MYKFKRLSGKFRRIENGTLKIYVPGDICEFYSPLDIAKHLRHKWEAIGDVPTDEEIAGEEIPELGLIVTLASKGWYDVINEKTGKPINDKKMRLKQAEALATSMGSPPAEVEAKKAAEDTQEASNKEEPELPPDGVREPPNEEGEEDPSIVMQIGNESEDLTQITVRDRSQVRRRDPRGEET